MYKDNILGVKSTDEIFSLISVMIDDLVVNMNLNSKADKKTTEISETPTELNESYINLEKQVQKYEAEIRNHVRIEQQ